MGNEEDEIWVNDDFEMLYVMTVYNFLYFDLLFLILSIRS